MSILDKLPYKTNKSLQDRDLNWICSLIKKYEPKRILEVGVSTGGSTAVYLDTIKNMDCELVSVDSAEVAIYKPDKPKIGSEVYDLAEYLDLSKFTLHTGKVLPELVDTLGKFDMIILDTVHFVPGEILDVLCLKNNIKEGTILVLDDINIEQRYPDLYECNLKGCSCNPLLLSAIDGDIILPNDMFPTIGATMINKIDPLKLLLCLCHKWNTDTIDESYFSKIHELYGDVFCEQLTIIYFAYKKSNFD